MLGPQKGGTQFCYFNKLVDAFQLHPKPQFCKSAKRMKKFLVNTNSLFNDICRTSHVPADRLREVLFTPTVEYLDPNDQRCIREAQEARLPKVPLIDPPVGLDGIEAQCFSNPLNDRVIQFVHERLFKTRPRKKPKYKRTLKRMQKFYAQVAGKPPTPEQLAEAKKKKGAEKKRCIKKKKKEILTTAAIDHPKYTRVGTLVDYGDKRPWDEVEFRSHSVNYVKDDEGQVNASHQVSKQSQKKKNA